jgi:hypothetical protein
MCNGLQGASKMASLAIVAPLGLSRWLATSLQGAPSNNTPLNTEQSAYTLLNRNVRSVEWRDGVIRRDELQTQNLTSHPSKVSFHQFDKCDISFGYRIEQYS